MKNEFPHKNGDILQMQRNPDVKRVILQTRKQSCLWFYPDRPPLNEDDLISKVYDSRNSDDKWMTIGWDKVGKYNLKEIRKINGNKRFT